MKGLSPEETAIVELKYASKRFRQTPAAQLDVTAFQLIAKISIITGWEVPTDKDVRNVLIDQFRKKLWESYANCNADEVEYAFRNYGTRVKDWGKAINLSLIDEVMTAYLSERAAVSLVEERRHIELPESMVEMSDDTYRQWLEDTRSLVKQGLLKAPLLPVLLYEWSVKQNLLFAGKNQKKEYVKKAMEYRQAMLIKQVEDWNTDANKEQLSRFMSMKESGVFQDQEANNIRTLAKQFILFDFLLEKLDQ